MIAIRFLTLFIVLSIISSNAPAESIAPEAISSVLLVKAAEKITQIISMSGVVNIFILGGTGQDKLMTEFSKLKSKGLKIASKDFNNTAIQAETGAKDNSIMIVPSGNDAKVDAIIKFCNGKGSKIICVSMDPGYVKKGIPLGICLGDDGKPKILVHKANAKTAGYGIATLMSLSGMVIEY